MMPALIPPVYFLGGLTKTQVCLHWTLMIRFCLLERLKNAIPALAPPAAWPNSRCRMPSTAVMQKLHALSKLQEGRCQRFALFPHSALPPSPHSRRLPDADPDSCARSDGADDGIQGSERLGTPEHSLVGKWTGEFEIDPAELDFRGAQSAGKVKVSKGLSREIRVERDLQCRSQCIGRSQCREWSVFLRLVIVKRGREPLGRFAWCRGGVRAWLSKQS